MAPTRSSRASRSAIAGGDIPTARASARWDWRASTASARGRGRSRSSTSAFGVEGAATSARCAGAGELMITSGGIDCLELVAKSFVDPGDVAVVEAPSYLGAIMAFRGYQADLHGVPMEGDGMRVDLLADMLGRGLRPKMLYTIPDHQNPTGLSLAPDRRTELVELARRYRFLLLEDVAYRELGFAELAPRRGVEGGSSPLGQTQFAEL